MLFRSLDYKDAGCLDQDSATKHNILDLMEHNKMMANIDRTMRLGSYDCKLKKDSLTYKIFGKEMISGRHRHRYEFNNKYKSAFENAGMQCVGINPETDLVEVIEIPALKWFVGVQFHPEYGSTVLNPNPLFVSFIKAALDN